VDDPQNLENILGRLAEINRTMQVIFPIHPRTKKRITDYGLEKYIKAITTIEPCDYMNLMGLVKNSYKVITDSGGLQKEAYFARKECAVLMPDTGWVELIKSGFNSLCNADNLIDTVFSAKKHRDYIPGIYGNGDAGSKIADLISDGGM
jgi:UDP-N-acetylglucosamine 2-epimerase (non-hydrolysing)